MFSFSVLASSSRANCTYVRVEDKHLLVDCGLSCRQIEQRLAMHEISPESIDAILLTHEHKDHISGVKVFAKKYSPKIYANELTVECCPELGLVDSQLFETFETGSCFSIGALMVEPFHIVHDAADPVGFRLSYGDSVLVVLTDAGQVSNLIRHSLKNANAIVLESNYDPVLLDGCPYPWELKQRIKGQNGHLSNEAAAKLLAELREHDTLPQIVVGAHVSENSNEPALVREAFEASYADLPADELPQIFVAGAKEPMPLVTINVSSPPGESSAGQFHEPEQGKLF